ncbi:MAG: hypothetical protein VB140_10340 [Burkholderia sp.]
MQQRPSSHSIYATTPFKDHALWINNTDLKENVTKQAPVRTKGHLKKAFISHLRHLQKSPKYVALYFIHVDPLCGLIQDHKFRMNRFMQQCRPR